MHLCLITAPTLLQSTRLVMMSYDIRFIISIVIYIFNFHVDIIGTSGSSLRKHEHRKQEMYHVI